MLQGCPRIRSRGRSASISCDRPKASRLRQALRTKRTWTWIWIWTSRKLVTRSRAKRVVKMLKTTRTSTGCGTTGSFWRCSPCFLSRPATYSLENCQTWGSHPSTTSAPALYSSLLPTSLRAKNGLARMWSSGESWTRQAVTARCSCGRGTISLTGGPSSSYSWALPSRPAFTCPSS